MYLAIVHHYGGGTTNYVNDTPQELVAELTKDGIIDEITGENTNEIYFYEIGQELQLEYVIPKPIINLVPFN
jgi:hypothetical protein